MEPVERRLTHHATSIAQTSALEVMQIDRELEDLKAQITVLEAKASTGRLALDRLKRYEPKSQTTYYCPWCWIEFERKQRLEDTGHKFDRLDFRSDDTLHCIYCGNYWPVPPRARPSASSTSD